MPLEPGAIVGDYRVLGILGEGGMGQVYKVQNLLSNRTEAMKILLPDLSLQPQQLERFVREIQVQASLVHPNIAALHTASRQDNRLLMFMEFVDGETLAARLAAGALPVEQTLNITTQLLNALAYAHEHGVVHRDIKPSNIMLTAAGVAKLLDFGLAAARGDKRLTMTGNVLGSLHYMSPEQVRGASPTPASDIYSLGLTVYEMLTGRRGIEGPSDYAVMTAHLQFMPEPPGAINPAVPKALSQVVMRAVAKEPSDRFASALDFKAALDRCRQAPAAVVTAASPAQDLAPVPAQAPAPPPPAQLVQPIPDLTPPTPVQTIVQPSSEHVAPAPMPVTHRPSLALIGTAAGAAVFLIGGALLYWSRGAHESAAPVTAAQPVVQAPTQPSPSAPVAAQPTPSEPVRAQPASSPPPAQVQTRPAQQKPAEKRPSAQTEAKNVAPATPPAPAPDTHAATPPPATAPAATPPPVKSAQQQQAEEWARVSSSRDPAQLRKFLSTYPDGPFAGDASALLADLAWEALRGTTDARALREFATRYPASKYAPEALEKSEQMEAQQAVLDVLSRFQEAVSARDLDRVRGLWPRANSETQSRIAELFKKSRTVALTLRPQKAASLEKLGGRTAWDRAVVSCDEHLITLDGQKPRTTDATARVRLMKSSGAWVIESISTTPPSLYNPF